MSLRGKGHREFGSASRDSILPRRIQSETREDVNSEDELLAAAKRQGRDE